MIITKSIEPVAGSFKASVSVEVDPVETSYFTAYGEPRVDRVGSFPYVPEVPQQTLAIPLTPSDLGTVAIPGSVSLNLGLAGYELTATGVFPATVTANPGLFYSNGQVIGDWQFVMRIDHVQGNIDPVATDGFMLGMGVFTAPGESAPGLLFGWGGSQSPLGIHFRQRTTEGGAMPTTTAVARPSSHGVLLKATRVSEVITMSYSLNNGLTYTQLGTATIALPGVSVGLFFNSGQATAAYAIVTQLSFETLPATAPNTFVISGGPVLSLIRSNSPHQFSLDSAIDADAKAKVTGWANEMASRITTAKQALLMKPSPLATSVPSVAQV
jgi:hypothetical protein